MIIKWKKVSALEFTSRWQEMDLQITWNPDYCHWEIWVDGHRTNKRYASCNAAMEAVDDVQNRLLARMSTSAVAMQRPLSVERIVRHA